MNKVPSPESSSSYHLANMSLRQCHLPALPEDPAKHVSKQKKRAKAILL